MIVPTYETTAREQEIIINNQKKEIEKLHSIIKEVREYLDIDENIRKTCKRYDVNGIAILEILDKGSDKE